MKFFMSILILLLVAAAALFAYTRWQVVQIESKFPPIGQFANLNGTQFHYLDVPAGADSDAAVLFVHGASGNLNDQRGAFENILSGSARLIFVDRPGLGYSERGGAETPAQQAEMYKLLLDELGIDKIVLVGHSLGSASVAAFAVLYPERVKGLLFLAPATHPWPGGVNWYYNVASWPLIGHLFTETILVPVGMASLEQGAKSVFDPDPMPEDYVEGSAAALVFRPKVFRNNARDVAGLLQFVTKFSPRYKEIKAPTVVITGTKDDIVLPSIHSVGLEKDIEGSELIVLEGVGHKPDYVGRTQAVAAIKDMLR